MASKFYAVFGVCRDKGGTKKACYTKAVKAVGSKTRRKRKAQRHKRRCAYGVNKITRKCLLHRRKACCASCA